MSAPLKPRNPKRVALAFPVNVPWLALCMQGISEYAQQYGGWNLLTSPPTLTDIHETALTADCLKGWPGDGVIAAICNRNEARIAKQIDIPIVNLASTIHDLPFPRVMVDHYAMGRVACEHLLQRGFTNLAFYGFHGPWYAAERQRGFQDRATEAGIDCEVLHQPIDMNGKIPWQKHSMFLNRWLKKLTVPVGICAVHDYRARVLVDECHSLGLKVPQDVAVVGTENDTVVCEHCRPKLSSVARNAWKTGYEAAKMLDQLMNGDMLEELEIILPPEGVVERGSTDSVAIDDPHVRTIIYFMWDHYQEPLDIEQLSELVPVSRRLLEKRFRELLDCTPHAYLCHMRTEKAKKLLTSSPRMKIRSIATACGFSSQNHMRLVFLRLLGMTPKEYRDMESE